MTTKYKAAIVVRPETRGWGENKREVPGADVRIEVAINWDRIFQKFGEKAYRSKGQRSSALQGLIRVKVLSAKET